MTELARRTISELKARYELEPNLKDVYVEGRFDQEIISRCLCSQKNRDRMIYDIDSVDVPSALLADHQLTDGNKQRVIALARELADLSDGCLYRCVVDKDLDHWFGPLESTARLVWTDYCSIELYFFSPELLHEIVVITAKSKISSWRDYLNSLTEILCSLYALRLADRELGWSIDWLSADRCLSRAGSQLVFAADDYIDRLLKKNRKAGFRKQFDHTFSAWKVKLSGDNRNYIRGHDIIDLLAWTIEEFGGIKEFSSAVAIQRLLVLLAPRIPILVDAI